MNELLTLTLLGRGGEENSKRTVIISATPRVDEDEHFIAKRTITLEEELRMQIRMIYYPKMKYLRW